MAELEAVIEKRLIDQLCSGESQWTYQPDIRTEEQLWNKFKYILEGKFHGIFSNVQMFVVSNAIDTKYFSAARDTELNKKFITGWIDKENVSVCDYIDFAEAVLKIPEAHEMVTKYTVLDNDKKKLLILRPYQIYAIEAMRAASRRGESGFIWHTTGSGKTMTSYKCFL